MSFPASLAVMVLFWLFLLFCSVMHMLQKSSSACYTKGHAHDVDNWHGLSRQPEGDGKGVVNCVWFSFDSAGSIITLLGRHGTDGKQLPTRQSTGNIKSLNYLLHLLNTCEHFLRIPLTRQETEQRLKKIWFTVLHHHRNNTSLYAQQRSVLTLRASLHIITSNITTLMDTECLNDTFIYDL